MSATAPPDLPVLPFLENDTSMLTRKFGKEVVNYYAGGTLNRYSFLRPDTSFLRKAILSPKSRFIALDKLNPLTTGKSQLAYLGLEDLKPLFGGSELFKLTEEEEIAQYDSSAVRPLVVFLGLLEGSEGQQEEIATKDHGPVKGEAYFAVDITVRGANAEAVSAFLKTQEEQGKTIQTNPRSMSLQAEGAAIYAQARSMIDWNSRNTFCAGCGKPNMSVHAGYKRVCPPTDRQVATGECPTRHGISNVCFPRTDPTMIAAVVSSDGQRVLLGRQTRYPPHWYSTLAGFLEPGESIEEAVRREVWEEAGVRVGRVVIHSSQPWPYPSSLMIGAIAQALPGGEEINLNDKELESAKWFSMDEVRTALQHTAVGLDVTMPTGYVEGDLKVPPPQAIANRLMTAVTEGFISAVPKM